MEEQIVRKIIAREIDGSKVEVSSDELMFRPSAYVVIIDDGKVLLVPQWDGYDFPGGGVDLGERILEAAKREAKEETGLDVEVGEILLTTDDFFIARNTKRRFHSILMYFTARVVGGELSDEGFVDYEKEYARKAQWIPIDQVSSLTFYNPIDSVALIKKAAGLAK